MTIGWEKNDECPTQTGKVSHGQNWGLFREDGSAPMFLAGLVHPAVGLNRACGLARFPACPSCPVAGSWGSSLRFGFWGTKCNSSVFCAAPKMIYIYIYTQKYLQFLQKCRFEKEKKNNGGEGTSKQQQATTRSPPRYYSEVTPLLLLTVSILYLGIPANASKVQS